MTELLDSGGLRLVLYAVAAGCALFAAQRETRELATTPGRDRWPGFWLLSAVLLVAMGLARAIDLGDIVADLGRDRAVSDGWYDTRFVLQGAIVGSMSALWGLVVLAGLWGVIERRGRYLPAATMLRLAGRLRRGARRLAPPRRCPPLPARSVRPAIRGIDRVGAARRRDRRDVLVPVRTPREDPRRRRRPGYQPPSEGCAR